MQAAGGVAADLRDVNVAVGAEADGGGRQWHIQRLVKAIEIAGLLGARRSNFIRQDLLQHLLHG